VYGSVRAHVTAMPLGLPLIHGAQISVGEPDELLGLGELGGGRSRSEAGEGGAPQTSAT
jgi:hypothetical protein